MTFGVPKEIPKLREVLTQSFKECVLKIIEKIKNEVNKLNYVAGETYSSYLGGGEEGRK
ncbi:hypothetical protein HGA92_05000 [Candidatus Gracilibacteria bacterium]|nr:hypothetical protein [Candidatus Gracilibacteria bacterium]NUJ98410.1 hypothetical protein [Candidatus Gracilibacteria bacterium]